jgi:hypothetical protein
MILLDHCVLEREPFSSTSPDEMAAPPSYEDSMADCQFQSDHKGDGKTPQIWSIREQIDLSRTQHVASIVSQLVDHIRDRAVQGLSKTTLVLMPSDQGIFARYYCLYTLTMVSRSIAERSSRHSLP